MKKKSIISLFAFLLGLGVTTTSCEDMLTPDMDRYAEGFNGRDTVNFYLGILANVQGVIENNVILGEVRGDLVSPTEYVSDSLDKIANFVPVDDADNGLLNRAAYYKVINQCNFYLAKVDTMAMKNNIYYMRKEFAQVQFIRAWTYMQLVQLYGEVPFITEPVDNAGTGWEKDPSMGGKPRVNADNLLGMLEKNGLEQAYLYEKTLGYPNYGTFKNGAVDIPHRQTLFPGDLVLGDLYLLRGANTDYETAAAYYYAYLKNNKLNVKADASASFSKETKGDDEIYIANGNNWAQKVVSLSAGDGAISLVPSAANSSIGKTLTRVQQVYGFDPRSSNQTSVGGNNESVVSGNISITANYKNRQLAPSYGYTNICKAQLVVEPEISNGTEIDVDYHAGLGDCRMDGAFKYVKTLSGESGFGEVGRIPFVQKFGTRSSNQEANLSAFSFRYALPVYRVNQVYLRFAEAINRAGYPRHAFSILRNGLNYKKMPSVKDSIVYDDILKIAYIKVPRLNQVPDGNFCITIDELLRAEKAVAIGENYLDFTEPNWTNYGIHELGCGKFTDKDTLYTYDLRVLGKGYSKLNSLPDDVTKESLISRINQERLRKGLPLLPEKESVIGKLPKPSEPSEDTEEPDRSDYTVISVADSLDSDLVPAELKPIKPTPEELAEEINAVETLIADEMALETAYEGWRYFDLYRIARHKNAVEANSGTEWFAWLVARRGEKELKYYENPTFKGDASLYSKLTNMNSWYLPNPKY